MKKRAAVISLIIGILLILIGSVMLLIGLFSDHFTAAHHDGCTKTVKATVVGYEYEELHNIPTPLFEYTYDGNKYTSHFAAYWSACEEQYPVGSTERIKMNPNNPEEIRLGDHLDVILGEYFIAFLIGGSIISIFGAGCFVAGIFKLIAKKKE